MNKCIDNIRNHIDNLSNAVYESYTSYRYRVFFKGYGSYVNDIVFNVKGRLATLCFTLGSIVGYLQGRYSVKRLYTREDYIQQSPPRKGFLNRFKWRKETESNAQAYRKKGK